jgi:hypothetical protein
VCVRVYMYARVLLPGNGVLLASANCASAHRARPRIRTERVVVCSRSVRRSETSSSAEHLEGNQLRETSSRLRRCRAGAFLFAPFVAASA